MSIIQTAIIVGLMLIAGFVVGMVWREFVEDCRTYRQWIADHILRWNLSRIQRRSIRRDLRSLKRNMMRTR